MDVLVEEAVGRARGTGPTEHRQLSEGRHVLLFSRSAARAATRPSRWPPRPASSGGGLSVAQLDPRKVEAWKRNIAEAGLDEWAEILEGDARTLLPTLEEGFDVVFVDAWKGDYEAYFELALDEASSRGA